MWVLTAAALLTAALAWAQPAQVRCGPGQAGCGPAAVVGVTTTTLIGTAEPSWVPSSLGTWLLEEASGTRTNAQGTTSRNLTETGGTVSSNTTQFVQGVAAVEQSATANVGTTDAALLLGAPYTCTVWVRPTSSAALDAIIFQSRDDNGTNGRGFQVSYLTSQKVMLRESNGASTGTIQQPTTAALNTWTHVAVRHDASTNCALYLNGVSVASSAACSTFTAAVSGIFRIGGTQAPAGALVNVPGEVDELACWNQLLAAASICRICSCGVDGLLCRCSGTSFATTGRNVTACGSCALPADCSAASPS